MHTTFDYLTGYFNRLAITVWELKKDIPINQQSIRTCLDAMCDEVPIASYLLDTKTYMTKQGIKMYLSENNPSFYNLQIARFYFLDNSNPDRPLFGELSILDDEKKYTGNRVTEITQNESRAAKKVLYTVADSVKLN